MFPKPPKFVVNHKPVAVQVVQQKKTAAGPVNPHVLVIETVQAKNTVGRQNSTKKQSL